MNVLLVCTGGMSTSILMKKMRTYAQEKGIDGFKVAAAGIQNIETWGRGADVVLLGPQLKYHKKSIEEALVGKPIGIMSPLDYGMGNCDALFKQITALMS